MAKRERFDRSDVPTPGRYTNIIAVVVIVVVFAVAFGVFSLVKNRVTLETHMSVGSLDDALTVGSAEVPGGYYAPEEEFATSVVFTAADATDPSTLQQVNIVTFNKTQGTAAVAIVPLNTRVASGEEAMTLAELFATAGAEGATPALATATGVGFDHVIVGTAGVMDQLAALKVSADGDVPSEAGNLLAIARTDMGETSLRVTSDSVARSGLVSVVPFEAPAIAETTQAEDGSTVETGRVVIDTAQLRAGLGLIVSAA